MTTATIAQLLAQHVVRGWEDRWPLVTVICMCGDEVTADDHRGINRHLAVEELHARHQEDELRRAFPTAPVVVTDAAVDVILNHNCTPRGRLFEYPYRADESRKLIADAEKAVRKILDLVRLGAPKYGPEMKRPQYVRNMQADALEEAAMDMDALERLGGEPEYACSPEENAAYADYANSTRQDWLRARAAEVRNAS